MSMSEHGINPRALASALEPLDEAELQKKLRRMKDKGTLTLHRVSVALGRYHVRQIADKVRLLKQIGLDERTARSLGGDFQR